MGQLFIYYTDPDGGNAWLPASPSLTALAGSVYINSSAPSLPEVGDMWLRDYDNLFRIWNGASWVQPLNEITGVQSVSGTTPINVDNTDSANPVISVAQATNSSTGVIRIGTQAEANAATDTSVVLTPGTLASESRTIFPRLPRLLVELSNLPLRQKLMLEQTQLALSLQQLCLVLLLFSVWQLLPVPLVLMPVLVPLLLISYVTVQQ